MLRVFFKGQMEINSLKTQCFDWLKFFIPQLVIKELRFLILASSSKWENHIKILWRWRDSSCAARIPPEFYFRAKQSIKKEGWWSFSGGLLRNTVLQASVQGLSAGMHRWGSHLSWEWLCFLYIIFLQVCRYFTHVGMYVFICVWGFFLLSSGQIFPLDVSHKPQQMQDCSFGRQGTRSVLELRVSILVLWAPLLQVRCWLLPFKEHRLGDIPLTKHAAFFPRALLRRHSLSRGICQTLFGTHYLSNPQGGHGAGGTFSKPLERTRPPRNRSFLSVAREHACIYPEWEAGRITKAEVFPGLPDHLTMAWGTKPQPQLEAFPAHVAWSPQSE